MTDAAAARKDRMEQAAQWWANFQEADPSEAQVQQWLSWLEESPENAECFEQMNQFAQRVHRTRELTPQRLAFPLSARATGGQGRFFKPALAASILLPISALLATLWLLTSMWSTERVTYTTSIADQRTILLPDGSQLVLGGASTVRTMFSFDARKVHLTRGEAYFDIKPDGVGRPFIVDTGTATVQVLGTAFNVRRSDRQVAVTVAQGRVRVVRSGNLLQSLLEFSGLRETPVAEAGSNQQVFVEAGARQLHAVATDAQRAGAWRYGRLEFSDEPLDIVIEQVSRYSPVVIDAADPRLRDITYTGTFVPGQADSWLAALEQVFGLRVQRGPDGISVHRRTPVR